VAVDLAAEWSAALAPVRLRHPNGVSQPVLRIIDGNPPQLYVGLDQTTCTKTGATLTDFAISTVALTFYPGARLAQMWMAAAWVGYLQHEALELVTVDGVAVLDPHDEPYVSNAYNRGLRDGFPVTLTYDSMIKTLMLVMSENEANRMTEIYWESRPFPHESRLLPCP
jgi:hypothetical protein